VLKLGSVKCLCCFLLMFKEKQVVVHVKLNLDGIQCSLCSFLCVDQSKLSGFH